MRQGDCQCVPVKSRGWLRIMEYVCILFVVLFMIRIFPNPGAISWYPIGPAGDPCDAEYVFVFRRCHRKQTYFPHVSLDHAAVVGQLLVYCGRCKVSVLRRLFQVVDYVPCDR